MKGGLQMLFQGDFKHTIDAKNRIFMPARFREALGESFIVYPAPDGCLFVFTNEKWETIANQIKGQSSTKEERKRQRRAFYGVLTVEPDKQGRITLSPFLVEHAGLKKDVMIFGMTDRIEIWDMDRWNEEAMPASEDLSEDELYPEIIY